MLMVPASNENLVVPHGARVNFLTVLVTLGITAVGGLGLLLAGSIGSLVAAGALGLLLGMSPQVARQWERAVLLRMGRFDGLRGPGLFWRIPFVDSVTAWVDQRVITSPFAAEETLTSDTVPVNVDAVLFWMVNDPERAALEVQNYPQAVSWAAQTALRDIIGRTSLADLLRGRERIESELQDLIDARCMPWGVAVQAVEMRDIIIPANLQDAMSREAQATREKRARIILGEAEVEIAALFDEASHVYQQNPTALQLRAMNILFEGIKQKGALMIVPSNVVQTMGLGGMMGAAALEQQVKAGQAAAEPEPVAS
jgi:regulator of protease activity HflC (stomatin/prohibitin superfamily)